MQLFHEYHSNQCQFAFDLLALSERKKQFTENELEELFGKYHAKYIWPDVKQQMLEYGILEGTARNMYQIGPLFRPFRALLSELERTYLKFICNTPQAALFLSSDTRKKIDENCETADISFLYSMGFPECSAGLNIIPEVFRVMLRAIAQGRSVSYYFRPQSAETWNQSSGVIPYRLEYSVLDGRWWAIMYLPEEDRPIKTRLDCLRDAILGQRHFISEQQIQEAILRQVEPEKVILHIVPEKNGLERAFLTFENALDLTARQLENGSVEMMFSMFRFDKMDILKKLLYLGETTTLIAPEFMRQEMCNRLDLCLNQGISSQTGLEEG